MPVATLVPEKRVERAAARDDAARGQAAVRQPTPQLLESLRRHSERLETATPSEVLSWAVEEYFPKLTMATAFGPEGCVILHLLAQIEPRVHVFNLDTGYQFHETLKLRDRIADSYGIEVHLERADTTVEEYERQHGGPLYTHAARPVLLRPQGQGAARACRGISTPG